MNHGDEDGWRSVEDEAIAAENTKIAAAMSLRTSKKSTRIADSVTDTWVCNDLAQAPQEKRAFDGRHDWHRPRKQQQT